MVSNIVRMDLSQDDTSDATRDHGPLGALGTACTELSPAERLFAGLFLALAVVSGTTLLYRANATTFLDVPRMGGTHVEGIVSTPRFINPLLAGTEADRDLTAVVYAGLLTHGPDGTLVPELAESYSVSDDGKTYTFVLKEGLTFQDGVPLTADDVVFTTKAAANAAIRSPIFANWDGVQVEATDERTVTFTLPKAYAPFIENTTLGILPKHLWDGLTPEEFSFSQLNITPVGAGPYSVQNIVRDRSGIPTSYELASFPQYARGAPNIARLVFRLYRNSDEVLNAFIRGDVDAIHGITPARTSQLLENGAISRSALLRAPLLRVFGIFFNHNKQPIFLRDEVRAALEEATPKQAVVGEVLHGYGTVLTGPLPDFARGPREVLSATGSTTAASSTDTGTTTALQVDHIARARTILEKAGWTRDASSSTYVLKKKDGDLRLAFTLTTVNVPEVKDAAERIATSWREIGAEVEVKVFDESDMLPSVVRPRRYEALLYGEVLGHGLDLYAFWHSSQRNDPGLNIAQFADIESDTLLEKARATNDMAEREQLFDAFIKRVQDEHAAIFLYAPDLIYLMRDHVQNIALHPIAEPSERFDNIYQWYIETDRVWPWVEKVLHWRGTN
jgi:peptide/nickel transport system substrate-binding protein